MLGKRERNDLTVDESKSTDVLVEPQDNATSLPCDTGYENEKNDDDKASKRPYTQDRSGVSSSSPPSPSSSSSSPIPSPSNTRIVHEVSSSSSATSQEPAAPTKLHKPIIKFLFPNEWIGHLIGRAGSIISNLSTITHTVIKVSQTRDFYPGTQDRCVMCTAENPENLYTAIDHITQILIKAQDSTRSEYYITFIFLLTNFIQEMIKSLSLFDIFVVIKPNYSCRYEWSAQHD